MNTELKDALAEVQKNLETKTTEQIVKELKEVKTTIDEVVEKKAAELAETKSKEVVEVELKAFKDELEKAHSLKIKGLQDHLDKLDVKLKARKAGEKAGDDALKLLVKENFDTIKLVKKGNSLSIETKAVGDMTLGNNLTGDQPRAYSNVVAMVPSQLLNFADLVQAITIAGGTYTFPRETGQEGGIATQVEGANKSQIDYDIEMIDVNTDFIAGFAVYSKKMANNLPFLESFLPQALRRDYWKQENTTFNAVLVAGAQASAQIITGKNKVEMLINEIATLEEADFSANAIVVRPSDYYDILKTEKSSGAGYGLPGIVTQEGGVLRINGMPVFKANWLGANKYYVGDWTRVKKIVTEGLSVEFSNEDTDNFRKNNITARVESQVGLAIERTDAIIYGDFTAV